ncbi:MAG: hypothetical protein ABIP95_04740 [Pelobium sp.]
MEFPSKIIDVLKYIEHEPGITVAFAAFHPFALLIILLIPLWILKKTGIYKSKPDLGSFGFSVTVIFFVGWLLGFASTILLFFIGITGLKLFFIYIAMYLCITAFVIFNIAPLKKAFQKSQLKKLSESIKN